MRYWYFDTVKDGKVGCRVGRKGCGGGGVVGWEEGLWGVVGWEEGGGGRL